MRLGDNASGEWTNFLTSTSQTPPGMRKANFREVIAFLQAPGQVGLPGSQTTDAHLGFACYTYQSSSIALMDEETHRNILMRMVGSASQGGVGEKSQKAKVGFCTCCSQVTHIAVPPNNAAGEYVNAKYLGLKLW